MLRRTGVWFALWALAGCAPGNPGMVIGGVLKPNDECIYETSNVRLLNGVLDVLPAEHGQPVTYWIRAVLFNQLLNLGQSGMDGPPMADPNVVTVVEAEVELRDINGVPLALGALPNPYRVPATGFVPSSDGTSAGSGIGSAQIIPAIYGSALAGLGDATIVAAVQMIGRTAGDAEVITPALEWTIELCRGCLWACVTVDGEELCDPSCTPGQDEVVISPGVCREPPIFANCAVGS